MKNTDPMKYLKYMKEPDAPMTRAQKHIICGDRGKKRKSRCKEYGRDVVLGAVAEAFNVPFESLILEKLTKSQAQYIITHFKPHNPAGDRRAEKRKAYEERMKAQNESGHTKTESEEQ